MLVALPFVGLTTSCEDVELIEEDSSVSLLEDYQKEYTLNLAVTLDNMGGTARDILDPMEEIENYISPEKFRVLFFDDKDKFLFESKSRRVKKLSTNTDHSEWLVSVPFYDSGNDTEYSWEWDTIREALTKKRFKVAILANRPEIECYPDLTNNNLGPSKNFDNSGPKWKREDRGKKDIFDLHHCQWDPIYTDKGRKNRDGKEGFYEFIMERNLNEPDPLKQLEMGATSCWVDHGPTLTDDGKQYDYGGKQPRRRWRHPTQDYPIPMYGVQVFEPVTNWVKGTPFNLSDILRGGNKDYAYKSISLLRSVVKLELLIPKTLNGVNVAKPTYISLWYSNIYARCEPMNVWDPTEDIWEDDHDNDCEWKYIMNYGALATSSSPTGTATSNDNSFYAYRQVLSWFYGAWRDKGWSFGTLGKSSNTYDKATLSTSTTPYPKVFNTCIQRNQIVMLDELTDVNSKYNDGYYHYIVYTGERNVNDPSDLHNIGDENSGKPTVIYWMFNIGKDLYSLPIRDYSTYNAGLKQTNVFNPDKPVEPSNTVGAYEKLVRSNPKNKNYMPWPLIRNHVYRMTLTASRADDGEVPVRIEDLSSKSIKFYSEE